MPDPWIIPAEISRRANDSPPYLVQCEWPLNRNQPIVNVVWYIQISHLTEKATVINICSVYQFFLLNAFVLLIFVNFLILINVTWKKLCRIAWYIKFTKQLTIRLSVRFILYWLFGNEFCWLLHEQIGISNLHELQKNFNTKFTNRLKKCQRLLSAFANVIFL